MVLKKSPLRIPLLVIYTYYMYVCVQRYAGECCVSGCDWRGIQPARYRLGVQVMLSLNCVETIAD